MKETGVDTAGIGMSAGTVSTFAGAVDTFTGSSGFLDPVIELDLDPTFLVLLTG